MTRYVAALSIIGVALTSCTPVPSLWGVYSTPTSEYSSSIPVILAALPASASPTAPLLPSASFTQTPTSVPVASDTAIATLTGTPGTTLVDSTLTPTFDVPAMLYYSQSGDTVPALAARFSVTASDVRANAALPEGALIAPGTLLVIPDRIADPTTPNIQIIPDSELVFPAASADFDIQAYVKSAGGLLGSYREYLGSTGWTTGSDEIHRLAYENSINPRLLLALLDYESRWVHGESVDASHRDYPMGYPNVFYKGMFSQMVWAVNQLSIGYYGWRAGTVRTLEFPDGTSLRLDPRLNAGTVAIQYLFSKMHDQSQWAQMIDTSSGFSAVYTQMFGDPWARAQTVEPLFPAGIAQPQLTLPFEPKIEWSYTGGPHGAWEHDGSLAAVDFAPSTDHGGCDPTQTWVTASAPGLIVRSEHGVVVEDLDGDGYEQTGWDLLYLHISTEDRVPAGTYVQTNDRIGHASCEGGVATGTHLHFARKYNGEWVAADGPLPFILSGWTVHEGSLPYEGTLTRGNRVIIADPVGQLSSVIIRQPNDP